MAIGINLGLDDENIVADDAILNKELSKIKESKRHELENTFKPDYASIVDQAERKFKLTESSTDIISRKDSYLSTGLLGTDLILGGGLLPGGVYTFFGGESSGKSTMTSHILHSAILSDIDLIIMFDFEGSTDPIYLGNMINRKGGTVPAEHIFGLRDNTGKWIIKPKARLYAPSVGEEFFDSAASICRNLPDKMYIDKQWFYAYENTKENRKLVGDNYSKKLFTEFNKFFVEADNGLPQALFFIDSIPCMYPENLDADDKNAGLAATARMFSANIPKIAGKLKKKGVTVVAVNQLRDIPMAMYGPTTQEPGGQAVKFWASARVKLTSRSVPHGKGAIEEENSVLVENGTDNYRYVHQKAIKNKTGTPYLETWARLWTSDGEGQGRGFCPVWDAFQYLKDTGQIQGSMKKFNLILGDLSLQKLTWIDFKALILLKGEQLKYYCQQLKIERNPKIREKCFEQIKSGEGHMLYFENLKTKKKEEDDE